jgi:C4-dicarboxylate-specific signal transduction histidine kinase
MLHTELLQRQLDEQAQIGKQHFNELPPHIMTLLDDMAFGIAQKENMQPIDVKQTMVENINRLHESDIQYLIEQLGLLMHKSANENEKIDDKVVDSSFISFLIRLYY